MDAQVWQRVRVLFEQAIELPADARADFLDRSCAGEPEVRAEVEALIGADATARFSDVAMAAAAPELVGAAVAAQRKRAQDEWAGQRLGAWRLLREIGRGGMGAVYLAERDDGEYRQQAAIKLMRPTWDSADLLQRFRAERQILATLSHPNIARLLDGGMSADGKPYLVLEYIEGSSISEYCDLQRLGLSQRLALFQAVCAAVAHAHHSLIVHRDLKPSNILVNREGQIKLLDFGIAKLIEADGAQTASAVRLFTPEYAAPEQVRGEAVTTGVDVYALGLLLYQLLTGRRPYGSTASTPAAYEQAILTQEPQRPSAVAAEGDSESTALAQARKLDSASLSAHLRGDLDAIVLRALRKEPAQRYATVEALSEDVERYLSRRPVTARRGNRRYRAWRFLQRHALSTSLAALATLALGGGLALSLWQAKEVREQRDLATVQAHRAEKLSDFLVGVFSNADPLQRAGNEVSAKALLDVAVTRLRDELASEPHTRLGLMRAMAQAYMGLGLPVEALRVSREIVAIGGQLGNYPERALDLTLLGINLNDTSEPALAEPIAREALAWAEAVAVPDPRLIARILNLQAMATTQLPDSERADAIFARLLGMLEADPGIDPKRYEDVRLMISRRLASKGDFAAAEKLCHAVIADIKGTRPLREPALAKAMDTLGNLYRKMGRYKEQVEISREVLAIELPMLGPDHWTIGIVNHNLAQALKFTGEYREALERSDTAVRIGLHTVGAEHNFTTAARLLRAQLNCQQPEGKRVDVEEHAELLAVVLKKYPEYGKSLAATRALCELPGVAELVVR